MTPRAVAALLLLLLFAVAAPPVRAQLPLAPPRASTGELDSLRRAWLARPGDEQLTVRYARALAARDRIDMRVRAVRVLQRGLRRHPRSADLRIALADVYYRQGYLTLSRRELRRAVESSPDPAPAYVRLGRLAFRDWLKFQRPEALAVAGHYWRDATARDPGDTEPWLGLGILALLAGDGAAAESHAGRCLDLVERLHLASARGRPAARGITPDRAAAAGDPRGEAWLLLGAGAFLQGRLERADSAFGRALPLLRPAARAVLEDVTPAASDADTAALTALGSDSRARAEFLRRFWQERDPDLTTSLNELRLEFLTRGTLAYFLYFDQRRQTWDERGALLVRYGMPDEVQYNPPLLGVNPMTTNRLVWSYRALGMEVVLEDRYLNEAYDLPVSLHRSVDPLPDPEALAGAVREGRAAAAGRGVFVPARRGTRPLAGGAAVALFRSVRGFDPRLGAAPGADVGRAEVYLATTGQAGRAGVAAEAVVFDSTWREVARRPLARPAWCYSETVQVAQANFDLPAGQYTVGVSARDGERQAASSWRVPFTVAAAAPGRLELSDLELACEYAPEPRGSAFDKLAYAVVPNPRREVARGRPLGVYFEVYGLMPGPGGRAELTLEYTVRSLRRDRRPFFVQWVSPRRDETRVQVVREDEVPGRVRYQYVSADLQGAEPGPYRLEVRVRDGVSGQVAERRLDFRVVP